MSGKKNCFDAYNQLGIMLEKGDGIPINKDEAKKYYKKAADLGDIESMIKYSQLLDDNSKTNKQEQIKYLKKAV